MVRVHLQETWAQPLGGKIPWGRKWQPTPVLLPGKCHGQRSLVGCSPRGCKDLDTTERLSVHNVHRAAALTGKFSHPETHMGRSRGWPPRASAGGCTCAQPGLSWLRGHNQEPCLQKPRPPLSGPPPGPGALFRTLLPPSPAPQGTHPLCAAWTQPRMRTPRQHLLLLSSASCLQRGALWDGHWCVLHKCGWVLRAGCCQARVSIQVNSV